MEFRAHLSFTAGQTLTELTVEDLLKESVPRCSGPMCDREPDLPLQRRSRLEIPNPTELIASDLAEFDVDERQTLPSVEESGAPLQGYLLGVFRPPRV